MEAGFPGDSLLKLIEGFDDEVFLVAPYVKIRALERILNSISDPAASFTLISRWLPEDIASGVCDIEIFDILAARPGARFLVNSQLHAKYYRVGNECLVGSANVTLKGLGWATPSNLELMVKVPRDVPGLSEWEQRLLSSAIPVTSKLRDVIFREAQTIKQEQQLRILPEVEQGTEEEKDVSDWVPGCPVPERLWSVYNDGAASTMVSSALDAARDDLSALSPPTGLSRDLFDAYISGILKQMPLIIEIDMLAISGITDSQAESFLADKFSVKDRDSSEQMWRTLKTWLTHFFPEKYRLETGQEVLVRGRKLPR